MIYCSKCRMFYDKLEAKEYRGNEYCPHCFKTVTRVCKNCKNFKEPTENDDFDYHCNVTLPMFLDDAMVTISPDANASECKCFKLRKEK